MDETFGIVITGGTRGLGRALAKEFLDRGAKVFITGNSRESVEKALLGLREGRSGARISGGWGDSGSYADTEALLVQARAFLGRIDHYIANAGVNQEPGRIWEVPASDMERVVRTDLLGPMFAAKATFPTLAESGGWFWVLEGHGSDGRLMSGLSVYGAAKRGVAYLWRALALEARRAAKGDSARKEPAGPRDSARPSAENQPVKIGALSPGIMVTDFILQNREKEGPEKWRRSARAFNILADRPETVAAFLAPRILAARRSGTRIAWLGTGKVLTRFLLAPFSKRRLVEA
ncbi:MAG: SDR family oxidoreductase [Spirochaetaceae bacterium]|nr:SDR family oxidoreductase [Spirochaetaceae bacterium]